MRHTLGHSIRPLWLLSENLGNAAMGPDPRRRGGTNPIQYLHHGSEILGDISIDQRFVVRDTISEGCDLLRLGE
jgi:hypothetical protein